MSSAQINGSNSTGNYYDGGSTKNKGGASFKAGSSTNLQNVSNKNNVNVHGSIVVDGTDTDKALSSGAFSYNNSKPLAQRLTKQIGSLPNNAISRGASNPPPFLGFNKIESIKTSRLATAIRDGNFNLYTGKYSSISLTIDSFGADTESTFNNSYVGGMVYQVGKYPVSSVYNPIRSSQNIISVPSPSQTPSPSSSVSVTPITPTPTSSSGAITVTPTVTPTKTVTPTTSGIAVITTNSANFNNCAGNLSSVGTSGRSSYYGTYDMAGNVWEWTEGTVSSIYRVLRGGNMAYDAGYLSSTYRNYTTADTRSQYIGFRIGSLSSINNFVLVSDTNNSTDTSGFGNVSYNYYINKYEVTNQEYVEFLNAVATTDTYGLYINNMNLSTLGGISRSGGSGSYTYSVKTNRGNKPVNFINWNNCARYCNWLHNGKLTGLSAAGSTETGAYDMTQTNPSRQNNASFFILSENEWYKAAYYKGGSANAGYWLYATQSNTEPTCVQLTPTGDGIPV